MSCSCVVNHSCCREVRPLKALPMVPVLCMAVMWKKKLFYLINEGRKLQKTMRKNIFYTAALLLAGAVMAACSGSDDITSDITPEPQPSVEVGTVELSGTLAARAARRAPLMLTVMEPGRLATSSPFTTKRRTAMPRQLPR